jgi:sugar/nucleoside kinase (ribokinase family)
VARPAYDIVVLGDYFYDLIYSGLRELPELGREILSQDVTTTGGAMYITAVSMHRLGARVGWPAYFGNDYYSQSVYAFAQTEGLDLRLAQHVDRPYRRVTTALPLHGERAFVTFTDPETPDLHAHWLAALESCDFAHLHIGGFDSIERLCPMIELARGRAGRSASERPLYMPGAACRRGHFHAQCARSEDYRGARYGRRVA